MFRHGVHVQVERVLGPPSVLEDEHQALKQSQQRERGYDWQHFDYQGWPVNS